MSQLTENSSCTVSSGETEALEQMQEQWEQLYQENKAFDLQDINIRWNLDEIMKNPTDFLNRIAEIKAIPAIIYVLNYLLYKAQLAIGQNNVRLLAEYIRTKELTKWSEQNISGAELGKLLNRPAGSSLPDFGDPQLELIWHMLCCKLDEMFRKSGYAGGAIDWGSFFKNCSAHFTFEQLRFLALGAKMKEQDMEVFLTKVLRRSSVNYYNREEVFLFLTLTYAEKYGWNAYFTAYQQLKDLYGSVHARPENPNKIQDHDTLEWGFFLQNLIEELKNKPEEEKDFFRTRYSELEDYLCMAEVTQEKLRAGGDMRIRSAEMMQEKLKNGDAFRTMTKELVFQREELKKLLEPDLHSLAREEKILKNKKKKQLAVTLELTVKKDPQEEIKVPAGRKFYCTTKEPAKDGSYRAEFETLEDQILPPVERQEIAVPVVALTEEAAVEGMKLAKFVKEDWLAKNAPAGIEIRSAELQNKVHGIRPGSKLRFAGGDAKNPGSLLVTLDCGTVIPAGTIMEFQSGDTVFAYKVLEHANAYETTISLRPVQEWNPQADAVIRLKGSGAEVELTADPAFALRKGGKIRAVSKKAEEIPAGSPVEILSGGRTYDYLTEKKVITRPNRVTGSPEGSLKVVPAVLPADAKAKKDTFVPKQQPLTLKKGQTAAGYLTAYPQMTEDLSLFADAGRENKVKICLTHHAVIPAGTLLTLDKDGETYEFEVTEEIRTAPAVEEKISVTWTNSDIFAANASEDGTYFIGKSTPVTEGTCGQPQENPLFGEVSIADARCLKKEKEKLKDREGREEEADEDAAEVSDQGTSLFLRFLYPAPAAREDNKLYELDPAKLSLHLPADPRDFYLFTDNFRNGMITQNSISSLPKNESRIRDMLLTILFFKHVYENVEEEEEDYAAEWAISAFVQEVDAEMVTCGLQPFYRGYPYDNFLAFLLNCSDPIILFQNIWKEFIPWLQDVIYQS